MNYRETLDYLYEMLPMFQRIGQAAFKKDLTNTYKLLAFLGNPHEKLKVIHVAGTNGKGSVSHMLTSILSRQGYSTGLYTSPHLLDFRERIQISGKLVSEDFVINFVEKMKPAINEIKPSFFELTVAMAFDYFARGKTDFCVIETGLGGRLDSTNVVNPLLTVITNISLDHVAMLGNTLQEIAGEKAGIIKDNVPVIIGKEQPETARIFIEKGLVKGAPVLFAEKHFQSISQTLEKGHQEIVVKGKTTRKYELDLLGLYQKENLLTVLTAVKELQHLGVTVSEEAITDGLKTVKSTTHLWGRWDILRETPLVIADIAHNAAGIAQQSIQLSKYQYDHLFVIFGMSNDKDFSEILPLLPRDANYTFVKPSVPRGKDAGELAELGKKYGLKGQKADDISTALEQNLSRAGKNDLILITGSAFLIADALSIKKG